MISTKVTVKINQAAIDNLTRSPNGPVGRMVGRTAAATAQVAKRSAPVRSGRYRDSIRVGPVTQGPGGPVCSIISDVEYATSIEYLQRPVLRDALRGARIVV